MSTPETPDTIAGGERCLPVAPRAAPEALQAHAEVAQRALQDLARPPGGSLLVVRDPSRQSWWPHMPEPCVPAASIAEAHALWPTRDFVAVLIGCEIPDEGVEGFARRVRGVASCVRYLEDPIEGVRVSADGGYLWPPPHRPRSVRLGDGGLILADLGRTLQGSSQWHESGREFAEAISHLCYLERERCRKAPDRVQRRAASLVGWPPAGGDALAPVTG